MPLPTLLLSSIHSFLLPALPGCAAAAAAAQVVRQAGNLPLGAAAGDDLLCIPLVRLGVTSCLPANTMNWVS